MSWELVLPACASKGSWRAAGRDCQPPSHTFSCAAIEKWALNSWVKSCSPNPCVREGAGAQVLEHLMRGFSVYFLPSCPYQKLFKHIPSPCLKWLLYAGETCGVSIYTLLFLKAAALKTAWGKEGGMVSYDISSWGILGHQSSAIVWDRRCINFFPVSVKSHTAFN